MASTEKVHQLRPVKGTADTTVAAAKTAHVSTEQSASAGATPLDLLRSADIDDLQDKVFAAVRSAISGAIDERATAPGIAAIDLDFAAGAPAGTKVFAAPTAKPRQPLAVARPGTPLPDLKAERPRLEPEPEPAMPMLFPALAGLSIAAAVAIVFAIELSPWHATTVPTGEQKAPQAAVEVVVPVQTVVSPAAPPKPAAAVVPALPAVAHAPTAEPVLANLAKPADPLKEAQQAIMRGQIAQARLLLSGGGFAETSADAALLLARAYDPNFLASLKSSDVAPDPATAEIWYRRWHAISTGSGLVSGGVDVDKLIRAMK